MKNLFKNITVFLLIFVVLIMIFAAIESAGKKQDVVGVERMIELIDKEQVAKITVKGDSLEVELKDGKKEIVKKETGEKFSEMVKNYSLDPKKVAAINIVVESDTSSFWLVQVLPILLPLLIIGVFLYFMMRSVAGANTRAMMFGQSQAREFGKDKKVKVNFKDVAGVKEAKEELKEVVEFLKQPQKFIDLGARIPRGVLLLGGPGVGKTLLARAVAGEANVPFFSISGSEFVEMFVGVGASRVRDLFNRAKKNAPCIIFIDEIDAVGRRRGAGLGGSHDEREQTLNQILVEMDGFEAHENVIVMAATNRPDVLDPALLRPGRFDRRVMLDEPDIADREAILKVHARKKPLGKEVNLRKVAERTPGFSGADLANLLNEAAILAARRNKKIVEMDDVLESIEKVMLGPERRSRVLTEKEKLITAYHEAGHAIVAHFLPHTDPVHKISVIARGQAGGYTLKLPTEDKHYHTKTEFLEEIAVLLGGYMTEKEVFGEVSTGATSDLRRATQLARKLITDFGMSDSLGPRTFGEKEEMIFLGREIHEQRDYSEKIAEQIDKEISHFIHQGSERAHTIIRSRRDLLEQVKEALEAKETLEREEFEEIVGKKEKMQDEYIKKDIDRNSLR